MTREAELIALAERVGVATGPDRELEWRISEALQLPERWPTSSLWPPFAPGSRFDKRIPPYTSSLDAAMTLVPEGEGFELLTMHGKPTAFVSAGNTIDWCDGNCVEAATPALALCAAALRALSTHNTGGSDNG